MQNLIKLSLLLPILFTGCITITAPKIAETSKVQVDVPPPNINVLKPDNIITLRVIGQGLAPDNIQSKYQVIALAKRAAITDGYRLLVEKLYGVKVEGYDYIKNMVLQKSEVRTCVNAVIQYVNIVETKCADNFCEVELELKVSGKDWYYQLARAY
ncbi:MAG: hypothetical protein RL154_1412 [Pseudomonadota bacterium]|jgi:hypothetical protein